MRPGDTVDVSACPGIQVERDGLLDVNLRSLTVRGRVTLNGGALPDSDRSRGSIEFVERRGAGRTTVALGTSGPAQYEVILAPGRYYVRYVAERTQCQVAAGKLPCVGGPLVRDMALGAAGLLDLDLATAQVQGSVTVNGAPVPQGYRASGGLLFRRKDGDDYDTSGAGGLSDFRVVLLRGSYDVELVAPRTCTSASPLPCVSGKLKAGLDLSRDGGLTLDIPTARVSGAFALNGAPISAGALGLGAASFELAGGGAVATDAGNPGAGLGPFQLTVLRGTYDVWFRSRNSDCGGGVPCIDGRLKRAVAIAGDGRLDLDVPAISVEGTATIAGQAINEALEDGSLLFRNGDGGSVRTRDTGMRKLGAYRLTLLPGAYTLAYAAGPGCDAAARGPCVGGVLRGDLSLMTSGALNVDIPVLPVSGKALLRGAPVPTAALAEGHLVVQRRGEGGDASGVATADLRPFSLRLLPGEYDVRYEHLRPSCAADALVPCGGGVLLSGLRIVSAGTLDVNVPVVRVSGQVTLNQSPLPSLSVARGGLRFLPAGAAAGAGARTPGFGTAGPVSYSVALLPGRYVVAHEVDVARCARDTGALPCVGQIATGCN